MPIGLKVFHELMFAAAAEGDTPSTQYKNIAVPLCHSLSMLLALAMLGLSVPIC